MTTITVTGDADKLDAYGSEIMTGPIYHEALIDGMVSLKEAERMISDLQFDREAVEDEAFDRGCAAGYAEAVDLMQSAIDQMREG